ncbi:DUF5990 family protein [Streptomyces sp. ISL-1]|uniref:DUF5990 family protein n=1 Tax=Streptomyces sp. ISL-1 TaxID=2817657 RepID=UPI0035ABDC37
MPAHAAEAVFEIPVETVTASDGTADVRGPYVQGRRGGRFVCLTWGELPPGGEFAKFRRAEICLAGLPDDAVSGGAVETVLGLSRPCSD